jgi:DNA repair protein RadC
MKEVWSYQVVRDRALTVESKIASNSTNAARILREFIGKSSKEHVVMMALDARHAIIGLNLVSIGTMTASMIHPREVYQPALMLSAASIIIAHNHPSNDPTPSQEDHDITRRLVRAGEILGVPLMDHIVIADDSYFSFREHGLLSK